MNRLLATTRHIRPPKELEALFDNVPLVGNERCEDYDSLFSSIAQAEPPSDAIDWLLLKDFVDLAWEIRRERRVKMEIIKINQIEVICDLLKSTFDKDDKLGSAQNRIFFARPKAQSLILRRQSREEGEVTRLCPKVASQFHERR